MSHLCSQQVLTQARKGVDTCLETVGAAESVLSLVRLVLQGLLSSFQNYSVATPSEIINVFLHWSGTL
jgi:hypothetical protein